VLVLPEMLSQLINSSCQYRNLSFRGACVFIVSSVLSNNDLLLSLIQPRLLGLSLAINSLFLREDCNMEIRAAANEPLVEAVLWMRLSSQVVLIMG